MVLEIDNVLGGSTIFQLNRHRLVRAFHEKSVILDQHDIGRRIGSRWQGDSEVLRAAEPQPKFLRQMVRR